MISNPREEALVTAPNKLILAISMLAASACAGGPPSDKLVELRRMPERERVLVFRGLDDEAKIELFFQASRRHPPYSGLNDAIAGEGEGFLMVLREELDSRGGVPEVLSFMSIALDMKTRGLLSREDIQGLRIAGICELAEPSQYCPKLAAKLLDSR